MHIKVFTSFSGYDSQCLALERLRKDFQDFDYELVGWSEIDNHAIKAHNALFPQWQDRNYGDISKIDWCQVPDFDLFTYSSPCQDFSSAGNQAGGEKGSGTRSSLLWECERAIEAKRPKFCLLENVSALMSEKFLPLFNEWKLTLERLGYTNFSQILNAKDYGVPQNRERVFLVSIRNDVELRYFFPEPFGLEYRLKDLLEKEVDERYYIKDDRLAENEKYIEEPTIVAMIGRCESAILTPKRTQYGKECRKEYESHKLKEKRKNIQRLEPRTDGISNTITTVQKDNLLIEPKYGHKQMGVFEVEYRGKTYKDGEGLNLFDSESFKKKGLEGVSRTLRSSKNDAAVVVGRRIRKLTERECFRLMGVEDQDIDTIQDSGVSRSQQYKMAGNSIVVDVLYHLFRKMFVETGNESRQLTLF